MWVKLVLLNEHYHELGTCGVCVTWLEKRVRLRDIITSGVRVGVCVPWLEKLVRFGDIITSGVCVGVWRRERKKLVRSGDIITSGVRVVCVSCDSRNSSASGTLSRVGYVWCVCPVTRETRPLQVHYHEWVTRGVCVPWLEKLVPFRDIITKYKPGEKFECDSWMDYTGLEHKTSDHV